MESDKIDIKRMRELGWTGSETPTIQEIADDLPGSVHIRKLNHYWGVWVDYVFFSATTGGRRAGSTGYEHEDLLVAVSKIWVSYKEDLLRGRPPEDAPKSFK